MKQFNEYNELVEGKFGSIYDMKDIKTLADAEDPEIVISGMGTMKLSTKNKGLLKYTKIYLEMQFNLQKTNQILQRNNYQ